MDNLSFFNPYLQGRSKYNKVKKKSYLQVLPKGILHQGEYGCVVTNATSEHRMFYNNLQFILSDNMIWPTKKKIYFDDIQCPIKIHVYDILDETATVDTMSNLPMAYKRHISPSGSILKLFGKTEFEQDICVNILGQYQYFYCECESTGKIHSIISNIMATNNDCKGACSFTVKDVEKKTLYGFSSTLIKNLKKISFTNAQIAKKIGRCLYESGFKVYEIDVDYITRFLVDNDFTSFGWYMVTKCVVHTYNKSVNCDLEISCDLSELHKLHDVTWPNYDCCSFDIECISGDGSFPKAENIRDMVIQIAAIIFTTGSDKIEKHLFTVGSCSPIEGAFVYEFPSEIDLLLGFSIFLKIYSPVILTGYNINNFDITYMCTRMTAIYNLEMGKYSKLVNGKFCVYTPVNQNKGGFITKNKVCISGILIMDMYPVCNAKLSLPNYKLNTVAKECLNETKEDLPYKEIPIQFAAGPEGRQKVGKYCIQDALLVVTLFKHIKFHIEIIEIARLAHITVNRAIFDGQQRRIYPCILFESRLSEMVIPMMQKSEGTQTVNYKGATVLEPSIGFYADPTIVLDFASLYPSIMMAHNLCYSTLVLNEESIVGLSSDDITEVKVNDKICKFVKRSVRQSLLSRLLTKWLSERKKVKLQMQNTDDEVLKIILDKQQLALKVICNAVYGVTGTLNGILPCLEIASSVTALGREMLCATVNYITERMTSIEFFQTHFNLQEDEFEGVPQVKVIYGDTDSMFILLKNIQQKALHRIGILIAEHITDTLFMKPIKLEFEKILCPLMLICKKRYVGRVDTKLLMKGVEMVRKTSCSFVKEVVKDMINMLFFDDEVMNAAVVLSQMSVVDVYSHGVPLGLFKIINKLKQARDALYLNQVDVKKLVLTNVLSRDLGSYKQQNLPHLQVVKKLAQRREETPHVGDRVSYILLAPSDDTKSTPLFQLAEDPEYAKIHNLPIHAEKYFGQIIKAACNTISPIFPKDEPKKEKFLLSIIPQRVYISASFNDLLVIL